MLDIFFLLPITRGLLEGLDDQRGSGWDDGDSGLSVLDGELHSDPETFLQKRSDSDFGVPGLHKIQTYPITSCLRDIFSDLLG